MHANAPKPIPSLNDQDTSAPQRATAGPLAGVRILDLTTVVLGPFATQILASLGAEVIKIETPDGDSLRQVGPMRNDGMGHLFLHANRGKQSVVLNLKDADHREALLHMCSQCDVLVSNIRPAAMQRLGLDFASVHARAPALIYVSCVGYGQAGPYAAQPAYDDLIQGAAAVPSLMQLYGMPQPGYAPVTLADRVTGLHAVYAVTTALFARTKSGQGQLVEVPMFESVAQFVLGDHLGGHSFTPPQGPPGYARLLSPNRRPYKTQDGHLCALIYVDKHWSAFFEAIGQPQRMQDPRFCNHQARAANIDAVYAFVSAQMLTRTTAEWREVLDRADIPNMNVSSVEGLIQDPHLNAVGFFEPGAHPTEGQLLYMRTPTTWHGTPAPKLDHSPRLGEHTKQVLERFGCKIQGSATESPSKEST